MSSLVFVRKRPGIFEFPPFYHSTASFFICPSGHPFLFCHPCLFFYLSLRPISLFCHSGLRAGVQVNIDSLTAWIPGQARNDNYMSVIPRFRKKTSRDLRISPFLSQHSLFFYLSLRTPFSLLPPLPLFLSVTPAYLSILSLRPPRRSPGQY